MIMAQLNSGSGLGSAEAWQACPGVLQERPHAGGFFPLHGDEANLARYVVSILQPRNLSFVECRICFESRNATFNHVAEARADFDSV
jgi:hypothetical protein